MSLIHRYQSNGYNIVLDINSGCIHLVDLVTYEVLPFMEEGLSEQEIVDKLKDQYPEADIRTSVSECEKLKEQGMLFTRDIYENIIDEFTENRQTVVKALCLHIAHDCNLACRYCFAEEGEYHGPACCAVCAALPYGRSRCSPCFHFRRFPTRRRLPRPSRTLLNEAHFPLSFPSNAPIPAKLHWLASTIPPNCNQPVSFIA